MPLVGGAGFQQAWPVWGTGAGHSRTFWVRRAASWHPSCPSCGAQCGLETAYPREARGADGPFPRAALSLPDGTGTQRPPGGPLMERGDEAQGRQALPQTLIKASPSQCPHS